LQTRFGQPVDPGVELEADDASEDATRLGSVPEPSSNPTASAATPDRYVSRGEIARGGMGAIYKVRDKDLRRSLAMKVMLGGASGSAAASGSVNPEALNRFLEEAQVTAQLSHPGIVPVHELGVDSFGRVYFTMSLIRGVTLAEVIRKAREGADGWSMTRALQIILRVCETMAFAHDKGVIHRDIKPANVMVGKFGETYVMDWGLAKVIGRDDAHDIRLQSIDPSSLSAVESKRDESKNDWDSPIMTMDGAVVGTPAFMPPEQAEGRIEDVDKRSDVYAIGTLLYQLLTGQAPYVKRGARMSPHAVLAAVSMGPPNPIHELDASAPEELQAICEKAMARDRGKRYGSAEELAEEVQRFLSGHVVQAHRTGALIEMKKWIARNRAVAATAAASLALVAGLTAFFLHSIAGERDRAVSAEADARDSAAEANRERERAVAAEQDARDKAEEAGRQRELADARAVEAVEAQDRAENLAAYMLVDLRNGLRPIGRLDLLGGVAQTSLEYYQSLPDEGLSNAQRRSRATALTNVGDVLRSQGNLAGAVECFRGAVAIRTRVAAAEPTNIHWQDELRHAHHRVGDTLVLMKDHEGMLESHRAATQISERLAAMVPDASSQQYELYSSHARVSDALRLNGDLSGARASSEAALAVIQKLAEEHPENTQWRYEVGNALMQLGLIARTQGDLATTLARNVEALRIRERLAEENPDNAWLQQELALGYDRVGRERMLQGDAAGAADDFRSFLRIIEAQAAAQPADILMLEYLSQPHLLLGDALRAQNDLEGALASYEACVEIRVRLDAHDPTNAGWKQFYAHSQGRLGSVLLQLGRYDEAVAACKRAEEIHAATVELAPHYADQHPWYVSLRRTAEVLAGEREPASPADHLEIAYARYASQEFAAAQEAFEAAFANEAIRKDLKRANLYNAACSAALAAATNDDEHAAQRREKALAWLAEDLTARRELLGNITIRIAAGARNAARLEAAKAALLRHFEWARTGDSDLASIRGTPEFDALFEDLPTGE
jgi:tetratricopeptide (TPR) repeat protein/tRNA A-37 threonylcarbamoyl transferase component Bud32